MTYQIFLDDQIVIDAIFAKVQTIGWSIGFRMGDKPLCFNWVSFEFHNKIVNGNRTRHTTHTEITMQYLLTKLGFGIEPVYDIY